MLVGEWFVTNKINLEILIGVDVCIVGVTFKGFVDLKK